VRLIIKVFWFFFSKKNCFLASFLLDMRLHPLKGGRRDYWAVTVRANWRITWRFESIDVADVDLIDYP